MTRAIRAIRAIGATRATREARSTRSTWLTRRRAVLVVLALAALVLLLAALPWVTATTTSPLEATVPVAVDGHRAGPVVTAGALVAAAAALALSLGGRVAARVAGVGVVLGGALVAGSAVTVLTDPVPRAAAAAQDVVGVTTLTDGPHLTAAAVGACVVGATLALVGAWVVVAAGGWSVSDTRHRVTHVPASTGAAAGPAPPGAGEPDGEAFDDRDAWDALSRGEDPT